MNKKIRELADKSSVTFIKTRGIPEILDGCYITSDKYLQRFANMIIEECAQTAEKHARTYSDGDAGSGCIAAANAIRTLSWE